MEDSLMTRRRDRAMNVLQYGIALVAITAAALLSALR
jgi:hypothetical protein